MKILIIGGTNFIGPPVVHQLITMGHEVSVFHRGKTTTNLPPDVHEILGDRTSSNKRTRNSSHLSCR